MTHTGPTIADLKAHVRIEEVIGRVVPLTRKWAWYLGRCPFHNDRHPSLVVWPRTQTWKCMTCSPVRDDVVGFIARWQGVSTGEAIRQLRQEVLSAPSVERPPVARPTPPQDTPLAPVADRDATYRALLAQWPLSADHQTALRARGLRTPDRGRVHTVRTGASLRGDLAPRPTARCDRRSSEESFPRPSET